MKTLTLLLTLMLTTVSIAQMTTYPGNVGFVMNPGFLGPNYTVSNVQFTGHPHAVGSFICDSCNLGFEKRIILSTGFVWGAEGPNLSGNTGIDTGTPGSSLIPDSYNASILEFDVSSLVDTLEFRYVFGSDEYPEYVGSQYNDQFRIFIEGPGIPTPQNLSYIPSNVHAGINTINANANSIYYVNNGDGNTSPSNESDYYVEYDGFTVPLTAKTAVNPFQKYHITIIVTDLVDGIFDSGVFLEQCEECNYNASIPYLNNDQISAYPNPSSGEVQLEFPAISSDGTLQLINLSGQVIRTEQVASGSSKYFMSGVPTGSYIIKVISDNATWKGKLEVK